MSAAGEINCAIEIKPRSNRSLIATSVGLAVTGIALYVTPDQAEHWHYILQRLLYFPIIVAGVAFGWRGGGAVAVAAGILYLLRHDLQDRLDTIDRSLESAMFCLVGILTGVLSQRERLQRENLRNTALRLEEVYRELQNNVEHLKRAARMSALGHLSAGLAHEIRNPLASIEGAAYVAQSGQDGVRTSEFLEIIRKETRRLNDLVTHFLEFARPRAPRFDAVDARHLADSVLTLVARLAAGNKVDLLNRIPESAPAIKCDSEQMKQVLLNLVLNSIQAMPEGGRLTLSAAAAANTLMLRITDTGPGIAAGYIDEIFDPFFSTKQTGTGLGLPIAYQIVKGHGGDLILESSSSAGCSFAIQMPLADVSAGSPIA